MQQSGFELVHKCLISCVSRAATVGAAAIHPPNDSARKHEWTCPWCGLRAEPVSGDHSIESPTAIGESLIRPITVKPCPSVRMATIPRLGLIEMNYTFHGTLSPDRSAITHLHLRPHSKAWSLHAQPPACRTLVPKVCGPCYVLSGGGIEPEFERDVAFGAAELWSNTSRPLSVSRTIDDRRASAPTLQQSTTSVVAMSITTRLPALLAGVYDAASPSVFSLRFNRGAGVGSTSANVVRLPRCQP